MTVSIWRKTQKENFKNFDLLADFLNLSTDQRKQLLSRSSFPLNLPQRLARKIEKGTLSDPILKQFIPAIEETVSTPGYSSDPVHDQEFRCQAHLLHKYHGRALIVTSHACAMHCRYCFRKNFPYEPSTDDFSLEIEQIQKDSSLQEVIFSGGDPLSLSDRALLALLTKLSQISHIRRIRFHTRFLIGIPERIDAAFLEVLSKIPKQIIFVLHVNHPKELDEDVLHAVKNIQRLGIPVLCQTVLLKGVNDQEEILLALVQDLSNAGILPYYLHLLDRIDGSAHFEVSKQRGLQLIQYLQTHASGYCVPRFVQEIAFEKSKSVIQI